MPTTTRERYLAVVRWGQDEDAEHFRSGVFPTLGAAKNWAVIQTEDTDALVKVYREVWAVVDSLASTAKQVYLAAGWRIAEHAPNNDWTGWDEVESLADKVWSTWIADPKHAIQAEAVTGKDFS